MRHVYEDFQCGLERIAEELMGRRKWKLYQESMSRNYLQPLNNNIKKSAAEQQQHQQESSPLRDESPTDEKTNNSQNSQQDEIGDGASPNGTTAETPPSENGTGADTVSAAAPKPENGDADITASEEGEDTATTTVICKEETTGAAPAATDDAAAAQRQQEAEDRLKDWSPQSKCYFCVDGKLDSDHNNHGGLSPHNTDSDSSDSRSDTEPLPTLTPRHNQNNNNHHHHHHHNSRMSATVDPNMAVLAAVRNAMNSGSPVPHMSFYPQFYPFIAQAAAAGRGGAGGGAGFNSDGDATEKSGEEPLDLSSKSSNNNGTDAAKMQRVLPLDAKFSFDFRARPRMPAVAGKRTYTEDELQAALRDIQSGKLGTRRAAVIYGIPRSTLRNKVYKLALERERESHLNPCTLKLADEDEPMDEDKDLSGAEEEKEIEQVLEAPLISLEDIIRLAKIHNPDTLRVLLKGRDDPPTVEPDVNPILREVLRKMVVEEKLRTNGEGEKLTRPSPSNSAKAETSDMETEDAPSNVILKIPSFKPTNSTQPKNGCDVFRSSAPTETTISRAVISPPVVSSSPPIPIHAKMTPKDVKDVIAKSISVKFQSLEHPPTRFIQDLDPAKRGFTPPLSQIPVIQKPAEIQRPSYQPPPQKPPTTTTSTPTTGGKGTRPKRGKYRNYDRDSLVEAVRAVQRGEMSVHRAGSYYGVPHSTLEYKVKERHLMRPRKRDPKPNPVDEKIASLKQNDLRNAEKFKVNQPHLKPLQRLPPTSPNGRMPIIDPNCPIQYPFPFWPGFSSYPPAAAFPTNPEQYYASQMMQKLQEESRTHPQIPTPQVVNPAIPPLPKTTRHIAESLLDSGGNHSFLDGIIRSSLESGVPGNEEKKSIEDKNLPNLSNKALLDQLCRNSRLTPLPKVTEPSDEEKPEGTCGVSSPRRDETSRREEIHTIESSNDGSNGSPKPRIYLKTELTNPDNLKPEKLMRFRDVSLEERNGIGESTADSASDVEGQD